MTRKHAVVVCDIDGTLADITHRIPYVRSKPKNWPAFEKGISDDVPIWPIIDVVRALKRAGHTIFLASGRHDGQREVTVKWLDEKAEMGQVYDKFYMRKKGDNRADYIVKEEILDQMLEDGFEPWIVIDDRQQVVDMWRSRGYKVMQVAEGDF